MSDGRKGLGGAEYKMKARTKKRRKRRNHP